MADDIGWWAKKMGGILTDPKDIRSMKAGDSWVSPKYPGDAKFVNDAEQVRPRNIALHSKGGMVKSGSPKISAPCKDSKTIKCY